MKILLAGGKGYIGSHLYPQLGQIASVTSIDYGNSAIKKDFINLDFTDTDKVKHFADKCTHYDALIFLVGLAHSKGKGKDLPQFNKINYQTIVNLLSALDENRKVPERIIFASTISVYGEQYNQSLYNEVMAPWPFSPYAITKHKVEQYLLKNFKDKSWILRFAPVYSENIMLNIDRRTRLGGKFYRVGKGLKKLSLCNIKNIVVSIKAIIEGNVPAGIYNLSDPKEYTYEELLTWRAARKIIRIPALAVRILYYLGKLFNNRFLKENTIKLISDNIYSSIKIRSYVVLPATINDIKLNDD